MADVVMIRPDDIPGSLVEAIQQLPGFEPYSDGWEAPDFDLFPQAYSVYAGEIGEVEVSVSKLRTGSCQLMFVIDDEDDLVVTDSVSGVAWLLATQDEIGDEGEYAYFYRQFQAEGNLNAILNHEELLRVVRQMDVLLGWLLLGHPKEFIDIPTNCYRRVEDELVPFGNEELDGKEFLRLFVIQMAMAA